MPHHSAMIDRYRVDAYKQRYLKEAAIGSPFLFYHKRIPAMTITPLMPVIPGVVFVLSEVRALG